MMLFSIRDVFSVLGLGLAFIGHSSATSSADFDEKHYSAADIIRKDVLVVGGGSTGTYAAIKLIDSKKSVIVVEKEAVTGGHTNTYTTTGGIKVDYGVVLFHNNNVTKDYFKRFNIPLTIANLGSPNEKYVDFRTGKVVTNYVAQDYTTALQGYYKNLQQYPYVETGFDLEYPVPEDLLLPFGDYLKKYSLTNAAQFISEFTQGLSNVLDQTTLYVFKNFGSEIITDLSIGFLYTARNDNSELYTTSAAELVSKQSLLLSSTIRHMQRSSSAVKAVVSTPQGKKLIIAKQVLLTSPPKTDRLKFFDLSYNEYSLFSQFNNSAYYTALLRNTNIPTNTTINNARSDTLYNLPRFPGIYSLASVTGVPGLVDMKFGAPKIMPDHEVKSAVAEAIRDLGKNGVIPGDGTNEIEWEAYSSHSPFELTVSPEAIRNGFYNKLCGLQGTRSTWYTGAAFHTHDSSLLWKFTDGVVEKMLAAL